MNVNELKAEMVRQGKTPDQMCAAIGISKSAWYRKIGGESEFTHREISTIRHTLGLNDHQVTQIFFAEDVS